MSRNTELKADLDRIGYELGGAHLTRQARSATFNTFTQVMRQLGQVIHCAQQIGGRHLKAFVRERATQGISPRTCANELSHLRAVLRHIGKEGFVRSAEWSNQALGIVGGRRIGTKQPLSDADIRAFQTRMQELGRSGIGEVLELQRALGLREAEAIRGGNADTLSRWQRELQERGCARVIEGTKGGLSRDVRPANVGRALAAIQNALTVLRRAESDPNATGQRYLVTQADGSATDNLKRSLSVYKNLCSRAGIQSHGARYAFARERLQAYRDQGYSEREARAATAQDLGHGDGRGRYIASVYARGA
jgi:site-specific recombinase XerD